jgi:predicted ATPase/class 3 adenylate cyclase
LAALPTGTVTFLFTDLVASTRLWENHGDVMRVALARHDEILREAVEAHAGHVVKTTGDGVHAAFASPADAVRAAVAAQRALGSEPWTSPEPLRVRMGAHTGVAEVRDGDYYGPSLNRAARLMSVAHGGQIVVSLATEELARDELGDGLELVDLGEHQLRDLARPERVYQVVHPALVREFPALRTQARIPGNLIVPVTSLVGRDDDAVRVGELLDGAPMVTLIGVGGVGKTRLALHVAGELAGIFPDGAWFCDLAPVTTADAVPSTIAAVVEAGATAGRPPEDVLIDFLRNKRLLLVLDNCEHLVEPAGELAERILRECPRVRVLATSREALAVDGERLWPVRPLAVPAEGAGLDDASASPTVQLFVDRVRAFRPDFRLDVGNASAVVEICRRLDGIPLALELAAARARSMSPSDIATRLDHRFGLLTGGRRRAVARHETLRAAVDWSYDLLDDVERDVLDRVAVFVGGFNLEAAVDVTPARLSDDVVDVVGSLVDKSLLVADDAAESTRYRMLETIRQYALERLDAAGVTDEARDRHATYFARFAERAAIGLLSVDELAWHERTRVDLDNIAAATAWAAETGKAELALRLGTALSAQLFYRQSWEVSLLAQTAVETPGAAGHELYPLALACVGEGAHRRGQFAEAREYALRALDLVGDDRGRAYWIAETVLGVGAMMVSREDPAPHLERALAAAKRAGTPTDVLMCQQFLAMSLPSVGSEHLDRALTEAEEAMRLARTIGSPSAIAQAKFALGYVLIMRGEHGAASWLAVAADEGLSGAALSGILSLLAMAQTRDGEFGRALATIDRAIRHDIHHGDLGMLANNLDLLAPILIRCGDPEGAAVIVGVIEGDLLPHLVRSGVPAERRERMLSRLADSIDATAAERARARGAAMTYDEATAFALERVAIHREAYPLLLDSTDVRASS